jgi:hypothetical protein
MDYWTNSIFKFKLFILTRNEIPSMTPASQKGIKAKYAKRSPASYLLDSRERQSLVATYTNIKLNLNCTIKLKVNTYQTMFSHDPPQKLSVKLTESDLSYLSITKLL